MKCFAARRIGGVPHRSVARYRQDNPDNSFYLVQVLRFKSLAAREVAVQANLNIVPIRGTERLYDRELLVPCRVRDAEVTPL